MSGQLNSTDDLYLDEQQSGDYTVDDDDDDEFNSGSGSGSPGNSGYPKYQCRIAYILVRFSLWAD